MVPEAMRAARILKRDYGYETRVLNMHTLKPIDADAVIRAARETGVVSPPKNIRSALWPGASAPS